MTDRELLELAAKAAGVEFDGLWSETDRMSIKRGGFWNPLTDDGDALRLAVKLRLDVDQSGAVGVDAEPFTSVVCFWPGETKSIVHWKNSVAEPRDGDPYAATRRAIVRAAATIGQSLAATSSGDSR